MLIDLTRLAINKLERNYVNFNSRERKRQRQKERRIDFRENRYKEKKIDKKICVKDRLQKM